MIRFIELTAPESSLFRQAKIVSIEVNDGDYVNEGDTLFIVKSGDKDVPLPASVPGRVTEVIVMLDQLITLSTPLVLFETEIDKGKDKEDTVIEDGHKAEAKSAEKSEDKSENKDNNDTDSRDTNNAKKDDSESVNNDLAKTNHNKPDNADATDPKPTPKQPLSSSDDKQQQLNLTGDDADTNTDINADIKTNTEETEASVSTAPQNTIKSETMADDTTLQNSNLIDVAVPDIGGDSAKVVDILVAVGDHVTVEQSLITLESDKASMDVPSTVAGEVQAITINLDDDASEGSIIAKIKTIAEASPDSGSEQPAEQPEQSSPQSEAASVTESALQVPEKTPPTPAAVAAPAAPTATSVSTTATTNSTNNSGANAHASPSIRRFARELGVNLGNVNGTGRKGRISKADVKEFVKQSLANPAISTIQSGQQASNGIPAMPDIDFSKFGQIDVEKLNKIKRATATNLHRAWLNVPHVTHHDEANIADMDSFRKEMNGELASRKKSIKLSPLAFAVKAVVSALQAYPQFNSSLSSNGEELILKKYYNIGIAVETPNGLVVPVVKDADKLSIVEIAERMSELADKARNKKLGISDLSGASFSISSLGGIGGTYFTPIVNAPEVAILGLSRNKIVPTWDGKEFVPGLMLPLSLSYDHRVIDGAEAARFVRHIAAGLEDVRRLTI